jgi:SAM-dependent methyltransferase
MPLPEDLGIAYANYYTHVASTPNQRPSWLKRSSIFIKRGYWAIEYGYMNAHTTVLARMLGRLLYLSHIHRRETDAEVRFLPAMPQGFLLDVGCGSGDWLVAMQARGWRVEGIDFDQAYPDNQFDVITMHHVIEHLPDPIHTLKECLRILKPGGQLVLFTPNCISLSHRLFKASWRGLEPPRHIHIFSPSAMVSLLKQTGYSQLSVKTFIVTSVVHDSIRIMRRHYGVPAPHQRDWLAWCGARIFKLFELCLFPVNPDLGDCLIATARKP